MHSPYSCNPGAGNTRSDNSALRCSRRDAQASRIRPGSNRSSTNRSSSRSRIAQAATPTSTPLARTTTARRPRQPALVQPDLDQRAHGLQILLIQHAEQAARVDEVDEARIELLVGAQMPELKPVRVVDVRVAPHHLAVDVPDVGAEGGGESGGFAEPVVGRSAVALEGEGGVGWC